MTKQEFLSFFPDHCIQIFDDSGLNNIQARTLSPQDVSEKFLSDVNKKGAGIFFSVNKFPEGERKQKLCTGINSWYAESDSLPLNDQWDLIAHSPLTPSFIVKTKKSLHIYWLADNATEENFRKIQMGLCDFFHGDRTMKDIARVLRIPEYYHMKDPQDPCLVTLMVENPDKRYTENQMLEAFPYEYKSEAPNNYESYDSVPRIGDDDSFWGILGSLENKMMLQRISGSSLCNYEVISFRKRYPDGEYIYVNDVMSDAWIDRNGMIGSGKNGGPTWIQWLQYYGITKKEIAEWAKNGFKDNK